MLAAERTVAVQNDLLTRIAHARALTDELFQVVKPDALYDRPIPERHRMVFYIGHLEAFDWNLLRERALKLTPFSPAFDRLFAFGIDPVGGGLPTDEPQDWPRLEDVLAYRKRIRDVLDEGLDSAVSSGRDDGEFSLSLLLNVAIEHRLMHAETLAYMLHRLPLDKKVSGLRLAAAGGAAPSHALIEIAAGTATLGQPTAKGSFGWDNEFEENAVHVSEFLIDRYKVTNGDWLEFLSSGGYANRSLWGSSAWEWKEAHQISHPAFWKREGNEWLCRTMFDEVPLPHHWPVYVSHAEAEAYAKWAGKSLPTEAQWHRAAYGTPQGSERMYPWGDEPPTNERGNFDFRSWDPVAVNASAQGNSAFGVADMLGNGWEWTSTVFGPFPGFQRFPFYPGYSADFFDGKHYVMKGGSARTATCMLRRSFRNWFQPHYQYVYAGFRCVRSK